MTMCKCGDSKEMHDKPTLTDDYVRPACLEKGCNCDLFEEAESRSDLEMGCPECGCVTEELIMGWWACIQCGNQRVEG